jgi:hypothetical protein
MEANDIDDNWIINNTKQVLSDDGKTVKFTIALGEGKTVTSEAFRLDKRPAAMKTWLPTVREEMVSWVNQRKRAKRVEAAPPSSPKKATPPVQAEAVSPINYVLDNLDLARKAHESAVQEFQLAGKKVQEALQALNQWEKLAKALE